MIIICIRCPGRCFVSLLFKTMLLMAFNGIHEPQGRLSMWHGTATSPFSCIGGWCAVHLAISSRASCSRIRLSSARHACLCRFIWLAKQKTPFHGRSRRALERIFKALNAWRQLSSPVELIKLKSAFIKACQPFGNQALSRCEATMKAT